MTLGKAVIKPGRSTPTHYHPNGDEVLHVFMVQIMQTRGDKQIPMRGGDIVSISPGVIHGARNVGAEDAVLLLSYSSPDRRVIGE
jgi:quercetin dioxygenase-like cupin family protein